MHLIDATSPWWILDIAYVTGEGQNGRPIPYQRWLYWHKHFLLTTGVRPTPDALAIVQDELRLAPTPALAA